VKLRSTDPLVRFGREDGREGFAVKQAGRDADALVLP
jgi:hypothetical protein